MLIGRKSWLPAVIAMATCAVVSGFGLYEPKNFLGPGSVQGLAAQAALADARAIMV